MTARVRPALLVLVVAPLLSAGCNKPPGNGPTSGGAPPASVNDYRTLTKVQLQDLIKSQTGSEVTDLRDAGPNRYSGTVKSPDGTVTLPLDVTVEERRIACETKTSAGSKREIITPNAPVQSELNIK
jgi:hypothetical protein